MYKTFFQWPHRRSRQHLAPGAKSWDSHWAGLFVKDAHSVRPEALIPTAKPEQPAWKDPGPSPLVAGWPSGVV